VSLPHVTPEHQLVLETIYGAYVESGDWPTHAWLESRLERDGLELNRVLETITPALYWPDWRSRGAVWYAADAQLGLHVAGLAVCSGAERHCDEIVAVVRWLVAEWRALPAESPQSVPVVEKRTADLIPAVQTVVGGDPPVLDIKLMLELMRIEPGLPNWSGDPVDPMMRTFVIDRDVRRFAAVETIADLIAVLHPTAETPTGGGVVEPVLEPGPAPRRRRKYRHQPGEQVGRWKLRTQLGAGGNAEVWQADDEETGEIAAVKILHGDRTDDDAYARFRREIDTVNELARLGARVLPIIDYFLPEDLSDTAWYAMPVAVPLRVALGRSSLVDRVMAFAEIADELARLAERGWHHRDIKPSNLYWYAGRFVVGDFGLIKRPQDADLTRPDRVPGPFEYMPNEAVMREEEIDRAAFDLFCLAKSLWVVLVDEERAPRGSIPRGSYWSLSRRFGDEPAIAELDELVAWATLDDPAARGTLREHADGLAAWAAARRAGQKPAPSVTSRLQGSQLASAALPPLSAASAGDLEALVVELLRRPDEVGVRELARQERRRLEEAVRAGVAAKHGSQTYGDVADFWRGAAPAFERVLAVTLPLVRHRSPLWADQSRWMARFAEARLLEQGLVLWIEMSRWCVWLLTNVCGALATAEDELETVKSLLTPAGPMAEGVPLGLVIPGESAVAVGQGMMAEVEPGQRYHVPYHEYALRYLAELGWLRDRYGEIAADARTLRQTFDDFNFLATLAAAKAGGQVVGTWTMGHDGADALARRIRSNEAFRDEIADAVGAGGDEIASDGNELLRQGVYAPAGYIVSNAHLE
jgi:Protein kinase domain